MITGGSTRLFAQRQEFVKEILGWSMAGAQY